MAWMRKENTGIEMTTIIGATTEGNRIMVVARELRSHEDMLYLVSHFQRGIYAYLYLKNI